MDKDFDPLNAARSSGSGMSVIVYFIGISPVAADSRIQRARHPPLPDI